MESQQNIEIVNDCLFEVRLELFDGPIDLLLHLVKTNELPIEKVSLALVANQYMQCLDRMQQLDLEVAAEYLVIAATLLSIKASVLLNEDSDHLLEELENVLNPHQELLQKLRQAAIYKQSAQDLSYRDYLGLDVFAPASRLDEIEAPQETFADHDAILLCQAFKKMLDRVGADKVMLNISVDSVTIVERMMKIIDTLKSTGGKKSFQDLIPDINNRASIITTFLSILELCKRRIAAVRQDGIFKEIYIALADQIEQFDLTGIESEFDQQPDQQLMSANG